ncbi:hypothetical protein, partial [Escherichia coli]|uniref:hypothetical protein n=1 Tax=Escherichia coli TaxID=562 RepID=UPI001BC89F67
WEGWAILLRQKQKKLIMLPSETMIWQPEFTDKTLSRKPGAVQFQGQAPVRLIHKSSSHPSWIDSARSVKDYAHIRFMSDDTSTSQYQE